MQRIFNVKRINRMRSIIGLVTCLTISILNMLALLLNVSNFYDADTPEIGLGTLKMFTTISNFLVATSAIVCVPFQIQGLRYNNYHLPRWIVDFMYITTTTIALTFVTALTAISLTRGFYEAMFAKSNVFMHTLIPIISIILFTAVNSDHHIAIKKMILSFIPIFIYSIVYFIMVVAIGEDNGGWRDIYGFNTVMPWPCSLLIITVLSVSISTGLRYLHNKNHQRAKRAIYNYYLKSDDYALNNIEEAIIKLANIQNKYYYGGYIEVPTKIIIIFKERYTSELSLEELYQLYIKAFMNN